MLTRYAPTATRLSLSLTTMKVQLVPACRRRLYSFKRRISISTKNAHQFRGLKHNDSIYKMIVSCLEDHQPQILDSFYATVHACGCGGGYEKHELIVATGWPTGREDSLGMLYQVVSLRIVRGKYEISCFIAVLHQKEAYSTRLADRQRVLQQHYLSCYERGNHPGRERGIQQTNAGGAPGILHATHATRSAR